MSTASVVNNLMWTSDKLVFSGTTVASTLLTFLFETCIKEKPAVCFYHTLISTILTDIQTYIHTFVRELEPVS
jgi:hypothetical protein